MANFDSPYKFKLYGANSEASTYEPSEVQILLLDDAVSSTWDGEWTDDRPMAYGLEFNPVVEGENRKDINNIEYSKTDIRLEINIKLLPKPMPDALTTWQLFYGLKTGTETYANNGILTKKYHYLYIYTGASSGANEYPFSNMNQAGSGANTYLAVSFRGIAVKHDYEKALKYIELSFALMRPEGD
jgi:hypothetical protein